MHGGENDHPNLRGKQRENDLERIDQKGEHALENVEKSPKLSVMKSTKSSTQLPTGIRGMKFHCT
jgi:hypothetical protein